jgi:hypothetical protein
LCGHFPADGLVWTGTVNGVLRQASVSAEEFNSVV